MDTTTKSNAKAAAKVDTVVGARTTTLTSPAAKATATTRSACVITVNGCVAVEGGLGVNAGADVDFFGLFNKDTTVPLFNKKFDLFKVSEMSINMEDAHPFFRSSRGASAPAWHRKRELYQEQVLRHYFRLNSTQCEKGLVTFFIQFRTS